jgi:hypothetical protein
MFPPLPAVASLAVCFFDDQFRSATPTLRAADCLREGTDAYLPTLTRLGTQYFLLSIKNGPAFSKWS